MTELWYNMVRVQEIADTAFIGGMAKFCVQKSVNPADRNPLR